MGFPGGLSGCVAGWVARVCCPGGLSGGICPDTLILTLR